MMMMFSTLHKTGLVVIESSLSSGYKYKCDITLD